MFFLLHSAILLGAYLGQGIFHLVSNIFFLRRKFSFRVEYRSSVPQGTLKTWWCVCTVAYARPRSLFKPKRVICSGFNPKPWSSTSPKQPLRPVAVSRVLSGRVESGQDILRRQRAALMMSLHFPSLLLWSPTLHFAAKTDLEIQFKCIHPTNNPTAQFFQKFYL